MKNLFLITLVALNLMTTAAKAAPRTDVPKTHLTLTEAQINAIKNDRGRPAKENSTTFFNDESDEQLEQLLQSKLHEADNILHFRDHTSLDRVLSFSGLALQAWNPELRHTNTKKMMIKNIINFGFIDGFIVPTTAMINSAYAINNIGFGNLLNTMLADIAPNIADAFKNQYGIPTETNGKNFNQISNQGRQEMWNQLMKQLDPDFFNEHNETEKQLVDGRLLPRPDSDLPIIKNSITSDDQFNSYGAAQEYDSQIKEAKINDFINININGDRTAIAHYLKKIGKEDNSQKIRENRTGGLNSTPTSSDKEITAGKFRGIFSSDRKVNAWECAFRCTKDVIMWGLGGLGGGAVVGGPVGAGTMGTIGTIIGLDECSRHQLCGGDGTRRKKDEPKEKNDPPPSPSEKDPKIGDNDPKTMDPEDDSEPSQFDEDSNSFPSLPLEDQQKKIFTAGNKELIVKTITKEQTAQRKDVGVIYPTTPNTGE